MACAVLRVSLSDARYFPFPSFDRFFFFLFSAVSGPDMTLAVGCKE